MNILQITPEAPGVKSGGKLGVRQTLLSLIHNQHQVDYVGPEIEDDDILKMYHKTYILAPSHNLLLRGYDSLFMNTNQRYRSWLGLELDYRRYDWVVMDFTKLHYVPDKVPVERLIVRAHNVEADYSHNNYVHNRSFVNFVENLFAGKREKSIVDRAALIVALTQKDKARLCELYGIKEDKIKIVPVCLEKNSNRSECLEFRTHRESEEIRMILNGSLWYGSNYDGIKWFLDQVFPNLDFPGHLIIAGAKPNAELKNRVASAENITLVDTPPSMQPYLEQADIAIAPIFYGAGMKVKVAEALSYGLPIVGTSHAFEGYEIEDGVNSYCADTPQDFIMKLTQYSRQGVLERQAMRENSFKLYKEKYSQTYSTHLFQELLNMGAAGECINNKK